MKNFLDFGRFNVRTLTEMLFWVGSFGIAIASWLVGYSVAVTNVWHRTVQYAEGRWTGVVQNNWPLGLLAGLTFFIISFLFWRLICEMIYIVLNYFKENTPRKEKSEG